MAIKTHDFYYELPPELIAQTPIQRRDASRLLTLDKRTGEIGHHHFYDLPQFLRPGDCLVLNDSRVLPARLLGRREPTGGACEVVLLIDRGENVWECLVRPGKKLREGAKLSFGDGALTAEVTAVLEGGNRLIRFTYEGIFLEKLEQLGKMATRYGVIREGRMVRELTAAEVDQECSDFLQLEAANPALALAVLQERFPDLRFQALPDGSLRVFGGADAGAVGAALNEAGIAVSGLYAHKRDLEEFFVEMMGAEYRG